MWFKSADNANPHSFASQLRLTRFRRFVSLVPAAGQGVIRILDVGGSPAFWLNHQSELPPDTHITVLNVRFDQHLVNSRQFTYVLGDARCMADFDDCQFDLCFSNSVIEHVGGPIDQRAMASEIRRVSRGYFVQTPNRCFPIEPHFLVPGWQFLPVALRVKLIQRADRGWIKRIEDPVKARETVESIRLLGKRDIRCLFPDAQVWCERIGPFTKSFIAWRRPPVAS